MLVPVTEAHIFQPFVSDLQAPLLLWVPRLFIHWFPISLPKHLDYPSSTPGHGGPLAFSQAMHLALSCSLPCFLFCSPMGFHFFKSTMCFSSMDPLPWSVTLDPSLSAFLLVQVSFPAAHSSKVTSLAKSS